MKFLAIVTALAAAGLGLAAAEKNGKLPCCTEPAAGYAAKQAAPLVCLLTNKKMRERKDELAALFSDAALHAEEIDDGYIISLEKGYAPRIAEFIELERACCPFFEFTLAFAPENGPITLTVTGPEGSKAFSSQLFEPIMKKTD